MICAALLAACACTALAEPAYPDRPITLVVGFPPGGGADAVARVVALHMSRSLGQPIVIENKPGAGTTIASNQVARAKPDGYTLLLGSVNLFGSDQILYKNATYDGKDSFTPITRWTTSPLLIVVRDTLDARTPQQMTAQALANPGKLTYSSSGAGVMTHLAAASFSSASHVKMLHVPFKGGAPSVQAVAAGDVDLTFATPPSAMPLAHSGKVRLLGVTTAQRSPLFPDLPGMQESGVEGYDFSVWWGLFGPSNLPEAVVQKLFAASAEALADPEVIKNLKTQGNQAAPSASPKEFAEWAAKSGAAYAQVTKDAGVSAR